MKKTNLILASLLGMTCTASAAAPQKMPAVDARELKLEFKTDKSPIAYKVGEPIWMTVNLDYGKQKDPMPKFFLQWTCSTDDGGITGGMNELIPGKQCMKIAVTLRRPGFVRVVGELIDEYGRKFAYIDGDQRVEVRLDCGAGADIDKILPAAAEPADFRAFWKKQRELLDAVPLKPVMKKMDETKFIPKKFAGKFDVYEVTVPCAGPRPVTGHLFMQKDAKAKSLPAQVSFDGYGPGAQGADPKEEWFYVAASDRILFKINAHGYELGQDDAYYKQFFAERPAYGFNHTENDRPETSYFLGMALRVMRAFDFVKSLPEWDGKKLIAQGGSQGGLQATWAGSLVPELTECRPHVTWCCDINGTYVGRMGGWRPEFRNGLGYYDAVFHTRHIPATCFLNIERIGLGDYVCPPSGVAAQYNAANCPKKAVWRQNSTHMGVPPNSESFIVEAPASGKAPSADFAKPEEHVYAVPENVGAAFDSGAWTLTVNGKTEKISFSGRENLRTQNKLAVMDNITLNGVLTAEADGIAQIGVGADWWWELFVNGKNVYGRIRAFPGGNSKATFEKTDWVVSVPVKKGKNKITLNVTLGENGTVAIGTCKDMASSVDETDLAQYRFFSSHYAVPDSKTEYSHKFFNKKCIKFRTAQPYPAALEVLRKGEKEWQSFLSPDFYSKEKQVELPFKLEKGDSVRIAQHIFLGSWQLFRTDSVTVE